MTESPRQTRVRTARPTPAPEQVAPVVGLVAASDKLDVYTAGHLRDACRDLLDVPGCLTIDLGGADRIHTSALQVLVAVALARQAAGVAFALRGVSTGVANTFALTGLDSTLGQCAELAHERAA